MTILCTWFDAPYIEGDFLHCVHPWEAYVCYYVCRLTSTVEEDNEQDSLFQYLMNWRKLVFVIMKGDLKLKQLTLSSVSTIWLVTNKVIKPNNVKKCKYGLCLSPLSQ